MLSPRFLAIRGMPPAPYRAARDAVLAAGSKQESAGLFLVKSWDRKVVAPGLRRVAAICIDPQPGAAKSLEIRRILNHADDS